MVPEIIGGRSETFENGCDIQYKRKTCAGSAQTSHTIDSSIVVMVLQMLIGNTNGTGCQACPALTFPEGVNVKTSGIQNGSVSAADGQLQICELIPATLLRPGDALSIVLVVMAVSSVVISLTVILVYTRKRDHRLIKATSRELSAVILIGTYASRDQTCLQLFPGT